MNKIEKFKKKAEELEYLENEKKLLLIGLDMLKRNQFKNRYGEGQITNLVPGSSDANLRLSVKLSISNFVIDGEPSKYIDLQYRMIELSQDYIKEKMSEEIEAVKIKINKFLNKKWWEFWK